MLLRKTKTSIKSITEMTELEIEDSKQYSNMAPVFAKRINLSTF